jgi:hypothetical protein
MLDPDSSVNQADEQLDEVFIMRQELESLRCEKSLLKCQIARKKDTKLLHELSPSQNPHIKRSLVKELLRTQQYNATREAKIEALKSSDLVANIQEMEQEILVLYQEIKGIQERRELAEQALAEACRNLDRTSRRFSKELLKKNQLLIQSLEREISVHQQRIQAAMAARKQDLSRDASRSFLTKAIAAVKSQISHIETEIAELDHEIASRGDELQDPDDQ